MNDNPLRGVKILTEALRKFRRPVMGIFAERENVNRAELRTSCSAQFAMRSFSQCYSDYGSVTLTYLFSAVQVPHTPADCTYIPLNHMAGSSAVPGMSGAAAA